MDDGATWAESPQDNSEPIAACLLNSNRRNKAAGEEGIDLPGDFTPPTEYRFPPSTRTETLFRHSGWATTRGKIWASLVRCHVGAARLDRFRECGSGLWLRLDRNAGELHLQCNTCRDRFCVPCGNDRAAKIIATLAEPMAAETCRFLTLTKRHNTLSLADNVDLIYEQFTRLRHRRWWRENVKGGAAFLEVTFNPKSRTWHVHLHLIVTGDFLPQRELSREWLACTGDSSIVDVRAISDWQGKARYVTKYVTKPASPSVYNDPAALDEFVVAMRGRRLCATFGTWRGLKLSDDDSERPETVAIGSVDFLASRARSGDSEARHWLTIAAHKWPSLASLFAPWAASG